MEVRFSSRVLVTTVRTGKTSGTPGKLNLLRTYSRSMSGSTDSTDGGALDDTDGRTLSKNPVELYQCVNLCRTVSKREFPYVMSEFVSTYQNDHW